MPRSSLPNISSISKGSFEPIKKNSISLGDDDYLGTELKPLKVGGTIVPLELSKANARFTSATKIESTLEVDGKTTLDLLEARDLDIVGGEFNVYQEGSTTNKLTFNFGGDTGTSALILGATSMNISTIAGGLFLNATSGDVTFLSDGIVIKDNGDVDTPASGYGTLYVNSDVLYFKTDGGSATNLLAGSVSALDDLSDVTYSSGDLAISSLDTLDVGTFTIDCGGVLYLDAHTYGQTLFRYQGTTFADYYVYSTVSYNTIYSEGNVATGDYYRIAVGEHGATNIATVDAAAAAAHLTLAPDGHVEFDGCGVGFDLVTPTYNASDTDVDFTTGNKQFVTFGSGNIADLNLKFPATSGNFVLMLKQDGTGSRTVAADGWLAFDSAGNAANGSATVKFAGGSNPTLTTDANHVDIVSFFWDADNEIAYGVASLDFQF